MAGTVVPSTVIEYVAKGSPVFPFQLLDDNGNTIDLTGATVTGYFLSLNNQTVTKAYGAWAILNQTTNKGQATYQWTLIDLNIVGGFYFYMSVKLPTEPFQRGFSPVQLYVLPTAEYIGGLYMQEVDLNVGGQPITTTNPLANDVVDRIARVLGHVIIDSMPNIAGSVTPQVGGNNVSTSNPLPTTSGQVGLIAPLNTNPSATGIGADTQFKWANNATVQRLIISNETGADVRYELDANATANSLRLKDGNVLFIQQPCTVLHLYTAASQNINQSGGVMVRGYN